MSSSPGREVGVMPKALATIAPKPPEFEGGVAGSPGGVFEGELAALPSGDTTGVSSGASTGAGAGWLGSCGDETFPGLAGGDARSTFSRYHCSARDDMD